MPKLKTHILAQAIIRQAELANAWPMLITKGDDDAGSILVLLYNSQQLYRILGQTRNTEGEQAWFYISGPEPLAEEDTKFFIEKQRKRDPDLWVIECKSDSFSPPFEANIL
ncbi:DUF1491 family protein [Entomobacter blattae]|uniref:DUF1491 domain-containing protein n=1 Tax=Entomobacter blattae TaxID=2762277 RepID=A0A7H1NUP4_9PROT|nr:DUF1491 family protein [Entomobacter blattae]QNT79504.1 hypothetical protein JGUZn3_23030 [Entomobacter blattae]